MERTIEQPSGPLYVHVCPQAPPTPPHPANKTPNPTTYPAPPQFSRLEKSANAFRPHAGASRNPDISSPPPPPPTAPSEFETYCSRGSFVPAVLPRPPVRQQRSPHDCRSTSLITSSAQSGRILPQPPPLLRPPQAPTPPLHRPAEERSYVPMLACPSDLCVREGPSLSKDQRAPYSAPPTPFCTPSRARRVCASVPSSPFQHRQSPGGLEDLRVSAFRPLIFKPPAPHRRMPVASSTFKPTLNVSFVPSLSPRTCEPPPTPWTAELHAGVLKGFKLPGRASQGFTENSERVSEMLFDWTLNKVAQGEGWGLVGYYWLDHDILISERGGVVCF